jgi:hypothetical protein
MTAGFEVVSSLLAASALKSISISISISQCRAQILPRRYCIVAAWTFTTFTGLPPSSLLMASMPETAEHSAL